MRFQIEGAAVRRPAVTHDRPRLVRGDGERPAHRLAFSHRREVDGLRAIAVLPVILFHAGFEAFGGGFVGVDVFFVISGYLITSLIVTQKEAGSFSLVEFYERRARRILPALFVVVCACLPFGWLWLRPSDLAAFGRSVAAVFAFVSNILFWREAGYFDTASDLKPLLHTWSLAVEEQYYLGFPLFLVLMWKLSRRWIVPVLVACAVASLLVAQWGSLRSTPSAAFYLLPSRAWEILVGALVAFVTLSNTNVQKSMSTPLLQVLGIAGLLLIGYSVFAFDGGTRFPGLYALVPTVGTALVILFATADTFAGKLLSARPLVAIGLVSYSAYLWHQPLFAFARHRSVNAPQAGTLLALSGLAIVLAFISWRWVEQPFRNRQAISRRRIFTGALVGSLALMLVGLGLAAQDGHSSRFPSLVLAAVEPEKWNGESECANRIIIDPAVAICEFGDTRSEATLALYGDSHADALLPVLDTALRRKNIRGVRIINQACHPIPGIVDSRHERDHVRRCPSANSRVLQWLRGNADYTVIMMRWTYRLYPIPGAIDHLLFDNGEGGVEKGDEPRVNFVVDANAGRDIGGAAKRAAIQEFLRDVSEVSDRMVLVYPVPEAGWDIPRYNLAHYLATGTIPDTITTSNVVFESRNRYVTNVLDGFDNPKVRRVRPAGFLCGTYHKRRCVAALDGVPLYFDDDHLSNSGAQIVVDEIMRSLPTNRAGD